MPGVTDLQKTRESVIDVGQRNHLEALQTEVRRNNEQLTTLRRENKELRLVLQQTVRGQCHINTDHHYQKEEELQHNKMCVLKRSLNAVKGKNKELREEIEKTVEGMALVAMESATVDDNSFTAQKIRALENRLDKCLIKHNEVSAIRSTYETLLERLQREQAGFDTQLSATENALQCKSKDLLELNDVSHDAARGRDQAKAEVVRLKAQLIEERKAHRKDLEQRRRFVQGKRDALQEKHNTFLQRMTQQEERHAKLLSSTAMNGTQKKRHCLSGTTTPSLPPDEVENVQRQKEAYLKLRDVTMGADVTEVLQKLLERKGNCDQLQQTASDLEADIEHLRQEKARLQAEWEQVSQRGCNAMVSAHVTRAARDGNQKNTSHGADTEEGDPANIPDYALLGDRRQKNRRILEEFEGHLEQRRDALEASQREQEHLAQLLLQVEAGVQHLAEKLSLLRGAADLTTDGYSASVSLLHSCKAKLQMMKDEMKDEEVQAAAMTVTQAGALPKTNIRIPALAAAVPPPTGAMTADGEDPLYAAPSEDDGLVGRPSSRPGRYGPTPPPPRGLAEDFPDNEIHDRQELKMMSMATIDREEKKAKKQLMQRRKDDAA